MKNEPQLSAEMEKRLMDLLPLGLDDWLVEDIKHFLATALEEQRAEIESKRKEAWEATIQNSELLQKVIEKKVSTALEEQRKEILSEVLEMVKHQRLSPKDGYLTDERKRHQNSLRAELRTKLNQLKEGKCDA